jgi:hypothetical protein
MTSNPNTIPSYAIELYDTKLSTQYNFSDLALHKTSWNLEMKTDFISQQIFDYVANITPTLLFITYQFNYITVTNDKKNNSDVTANIAYAKHKTVFKHFVNM